MSILRPAPPAAAPRGRQPTPVTEPLKAERIQAGLAQLPGWQLVGDGAGIARLFAVPSVRAGALFASLVAEVAGSGDQGLEITLRGNAVTVTLSTPQAGGVTQRDFDVASRLEFPA